MAYALQAISKISPNERDILVQFGIKTSTDLLAAATTPKSRKSLEEKTGIDAEQILRLADFCELMSIKGIGPQYALLLGEVGIHTVERLASIDVEQLHKGLYEVAASKIVRLPPVDHLARWVGQAKNHQTSLVYEDITYLDLINKRAALFTSLLSIFFAFIFVSPILSTIVGSIAIFFNVYELNLSRILLNLRSRERRLGIALVSSITFLTIGISTELIIKCLRIISESFPSLKDSDIQHIFFLCMIGLALGGTTAVLIREFSKQIPQSLNTRERLEYGRGINFLIYFVVVLGLGAGSVSTLALLTISVLQSLRESSIRQFVENSVEMRFWHNICDTRQFPTGEYYIFLIHYGTAVTILNIRFLDLTLLPLIVVSLGFVTSAIGLIFIIKRMKPIKFAVLSTVPLVIAVLIGFLAPLSWPLIRFVRDFASGDLTGELWFLILLFIYFGFIILIDLIISIIKIAIKIRLEERLLKVKRQIQETYWSYIKLCYLELISILVIIFFITRLGIPENRAFFFEYEPYFVTFFIFGGFLVVIQYNMWYDGLVETAKLHLMMVSEYIGKKEVEKTFSRYLEIFKLPLAFFAIFAVLHLLSSLILDQVHEDMYFTFEYFIFGKSFIIVATFALIVFLYFSYLTELKKYFHSLDEKQAKTKKKHTGEAMIPEIPYLDKINSAISYLGEMSISGTLCILDWIKDTKTALNRIGIRESNVVLFRKVFTFIFPILYLFYSFIVKSSLLSSLFGFLSILLLIYELNIPFLISIKEDHIQRMRTSLLASCSYLAARIYIEIIIETVDFTFIAFHCDHCPHVLITFILFCLPITGPLFVVHLSGVLKDFDSREFRWLISGMKMEYKRVPRILAVLSFLVGIGGDSIVSPILVLASFILLISKKVQLSQNQFIKGFWFNACDIRKFPLSKRYMEIVVLSLFVLFLNLSFFKVLDYNMASSLVLFFVTIGMCSYWIHKRCGNLRSLVMCSFPFLMAGALGYIDPLTWPFFTNFKASILDSLYNIDEFGLPMMFNFLDFLAEIFLFLICILVVSSIGSGWLDLEIAKYVEKREYKIERSLKIFVVIKGILLVFVLLFFIFKIEPPFPEIWLILGKINSSDVYFMKFIFLLGISIGFIFAFLATMEDVENILHFLSSEESTHSF